VNIGRRRTPAIADPVAAPLRNAEDRRLPNRTISKIEIVKQFTGRCRDRALGSRDSGWLKTHQETTP
jgi:hypothetical protein